MVLKSYQAEKVLEAASTAPCKAWSQKTYIR